MRKKTSTRKDLLFLSGSSFIVVAAWVGFNIYHSWVTTTITPELQIQITPINPDFDMMTLDKLKTRKQVVPVTVLTNNSKPEPTPGAALPVIQPNTAVTTSAPSPVLPNPSRTLPETDIPVTVEGE